MPIFRKTRITNKLALACVLALGISACSSTDEEDEETLVAELTEIQQQFEPKVIWDSSVGDGVEDYFSRLQPTIAYGKLYSASREGEIVALDVQTGKTVWEIDVRDETTESSFFSSRPSAKLAGGPSTGIEKVFIGSEHGKVYAFEAETGSLSWQGKIKGEVIAAPGHEAGTLVVNSASGVLKAFNASNGEDVWQIEQDVPPLSLRGISAPVVAAGGAIVGTAEGTVTVYILENGQQGWTAEIGEPAGSTELMRVIDVDSTPVIFGDKVYAVSSRGHIAAMDLRTGRVLWKRQYSSYENIAVEGNMIFLTDIKGHVYAIDRLNGLEKWSQLALTNRNVTGPVVVKNKVIVGDLDGYLHWLDEETGQFVARMQVDSSGIYATPVVHDDVIYVQTRDGELTAIKTP
ncbi:outer membrane protein assembly factor BamB [Thalassotalea fusca]